MTDEDEKCRALRHMAGRPALIDAEFRHQFFPPAQADAAAKLRAILARHLPVDLSRLHPEDQLVEDLRMDALDSMSTVEFIVEVEKEFRVTIPDSAAGKMRTFKDVVEFVTRGQ